MKLLLIDDNPSNLFMLGRLAQNVGLGDVTSLRDPREALEEIRRTQFDLILVDYMMPGMDGLAVIRAVRAMPDYADVPIVMVTTVDQREVCYAALEAGATDFLTKPLDMAETKARLRNLAKMRDMGNKLRDRASWLQTEADRATRERLDLEQEIVIRLSLASEYRDRATGAHLLRVGQIARELAEELGQSQAFCRNIYLAAMMHDIGKIGVPDRILFKTGSYTDAERAEMQQHTTVGGAILSGSESQLIRLAAEIAETHHERWDGTGYPRKLKGTDIPLAGRITAVADVFDALVTARVYKPAWSFEDAARFISDNAGTLFDEQVVAAFQARRFRILKQVETMANTAGVA